MDNGARAPFFPSVPTNHASWVVVISLSFLTYSIIGVAHKFLCRKRNGKQEAHDWMVLSALLVSCVQSVVLVRSCIHGLGRHQSALSESAVVTVRKELFSSTLLGLFVHMLAKISTTLLILAIRPKRKHQMASRVILGAIVVWGVLGALFLGFRCGLASPWSEGQDQCLDEFRVYLGINLGNIVTDVALVGLPTVIMWSVQVRADLKIQLIALFASRILVPVIIIPQTAYLGRLPGNGSDLTWVMVEPAILGQVALSLAVLASCIAGLKGMIDSFVSGASQFIVPTVYASSHNNSQPLGSGLIRTSLRGKNDGSKTDLPQSALRSKSMKDGPTTSRKRNSSPSSESQTGLRDNDILQTIEDEVAFLTTTQDPSQHPGADGISQHSTYVYGDGPRQQTL